MALTTHQRVKEFLGIKPDDANKDVVLAELVERISAVIASRCNRTFEYQASITEYYDGDAVFGWGGQPQQLALKNYPVDSSVAITLYDDTNRIYGSNTLVPSTDYSVDYPNGVLKLDGNRAFSRGVRNVKVTYAAGYKVIPQDLERAAILLVAADFLESQGELRVSIDLEVSNRIKALRDEGNAVVNLYVRPVL